VVRSGQRFGRGFPPQKLHLVGVGHMNKLY
jgi:hypothetical protein